MIKSKEDALALCAKFSVKLSDYKTVIVTSEGNIYLNTVNVDPKDSSTRFEFKGKEFIESKSKAVEAPKDAKESPKEAKKVTPNNKKDKK
jgi:hypothetical protein